jgi:hypothetical protein
MMFRGYLDDDVWMTLAELSHFYRELCAKEIKKDMMEKLEEEIPVLLCKLEKIFPPGCCLHSIPANRGRTNVCFPLHVRKYG